MSLSGVHVIMPTPFDAAGKLDLESLHTLTNFLISKGANGLVVMGVMGEAPKLGEAEQAAVISGTVQAAKGRVPVFVGSGAGGTDLAIQKSAKAMELGASGLLVAPPPVQNDTVIFDYYKRINDALGALIILHDYPVSTGILLSVPLVTRLHGELEQVKVIKLEETPSAPKTSNIRKQNPNLSILGGLGGLYMLEELQRGANGIMTGFSYPDILQAIYTAYTAGNLELAKKIFYQSCALMRYEFQPGIGIALRKEVYRQRGAIQNPYVRQPGAQIDETMRKELEQILEFSRLEELVRTPLPRGEGLG
jgi:4-hydroxy-tetrahydrodipicolinate synthase